MEEIAPNIYTARLHAEDDWQISRSQLFVCIHNGLLSHCFAVTDYKLMTEDEESVQLHSVYEETYNSGCGEYVINKKTGELTIRPFYIFDHMYEPDDNIRQSIKESQKLPDDDILYEYHLGNRLNQLRD